MPKNSILLPQTSFFPPIGQPFNVLASTDSSNNYAMGQVRAGMAIAGAVYLAMEQTGGRGQRGKRWVTNPGENIMMSVVLQPKGLTIGKQFILSASAALACYDFFKKFAGPELVSIKWPNDLYWQDRKAGGILIESIVANSTGQKPEKDDRFMIVGIGININQTMFDPELPNPVSLKQITGRHWDILEMARELCDCLQNRYQLMHTTTEADILKEYASRLYKLNQLVKLKKDSALFETTIQGVAPDGKLITKDTMERIFDFGEVEWVR